MILNYKQKLCVADHLKIFDIISFTKLFDMLYMKWEIKKTAPKTFNLFINNINYEEPMSYEIFKKLKENEKEIYPEILPKGVKKYDN